MTSCNDYEGKIEMTAVLQGEFLTSAPESFHKLGDSFFMAKFKADELQVRYTSEGVLMTKTVNILGRF